VIAIADT
jgi:DNA repair protein RAD50